MLNVRFAAFFVLIVLLFSMIFFCSSCASPKTRVIEATAYCGCGKCNGYKRGSWWYLKLNFWDKYINYGSHKGEKYTGKTAWGTKPRPYDPGLLSFSNLKKPWMIPVRIVFFPWMVLPQKGTIAADTRYYPFGTKMYVPGYGWGIVEDRGGAIKGPDRIDLFHRSHGAANKWGRKKVEVEIYPKE